MTEIFNILIKKINNCATYEECELLNNWVSQDESNKTIEKQFINVWQWQENKQEDAKEKVWENISKNIEGKAAINNPSILNVNKSTQQVGWYKVAATVSILLISFVVLVYFISIKETNPKNIEIKHKEYVTTASKSKKILLPDNSEITLKANSLLKVPHSTFMEQRKVILEGQALFNINSNRSKPFEVASPSFKTTVTGTIFSISDYREDNAHEVVLLQGKLSVNLLHNQSEVVIEEGQAISFKSNSGKYIRKEIKIEMVDWLGENLVFESDDFGTVLRKLERYFNLKIDVQSKSIDRKSSFNGVFYKDDSVEDILNVLSKQFDFTYDVLTNGNVVIK